MTHVRGTTGDVLEHQVFQTPFLKPHHRHSAPTHSVGAPPTLWEPPLPPLIACCGGFGVFWCASCALQLLRLQQEWVRFGGLFKLGGHILKWLQLHWEGWPTLLTGDSH